MKRHLGVVLAIVGCVVVFIGWRMYYTHRYIPIKAVQPIVRLLDEGGLGSVERGMLLIRGLMWGQLPNGRRSMTPDPNRIKITGAGAKKVKQALLLAMEKATDPATLDYLLICVGASAEERTLIFQGEKEWAIIGAAAERLSAQPWRIRFFVTKDTNGVTVLGIGSRVEMP